MKTFLQICIRRLNQFKTNRSVRISAFGLGNKMKTTTKVVNGVPTNVLTFGKSIDDNLSNVDYILLLFPGNPGVIWYYKDFLQSLYTQMQEKYPSKNIPVWGVSHAGHIPKRDCAGNFPDLKENAHLYEIHGQVEHKKEFLRKFVPSDVKVHGIGHSIGSYMWLKTMKAIKQENNSNVKFPSVEKCYMLFPTLERMRDTPNGKFLCSFIVPFYTFWNLFFVWPICTFLPTFLLRFYLRFHLSSYPRVSECTLDASIDLFEYDVFSRFARLGNSEMEQVLDLDEDAVMDFKDNIFIYFGASDKWCPMDYVHDMKTRFPDLQHKICDRGIDHAFVVSSSEEMATIVSDVINIKA